MSIKYYVIVLITIILVFILRTLIRKSKKKSCGSPICLFPDKKTPPLKKTKSYKENMEEIRKKLERIKKEEEKKK